MTDEPAGTPLVVVHGWERDRRATLARALTEAGVRVRRSSGHAELAKALADGAATMVVVGPDDDVSALAAHIGMRPVIRATPDDEMETLVHRALALIQRS